jgi:hypothetical protein
MRLSSAIGVAIISAANGPAMAKELPVDEARAASRSNFHRPTLVMKRANHTYTGLYDSGVIHQELISKKIVCH